MTEQEALDSLDDLYRERRALQDLQESEGWKIFCGWMEDNIKAKEMSVHFGPPPSMDQIPAHFKTIGEIAVHKYFAGFVGLRLEQIEQGMKDLNQFLEMKEFNNG